MQIDITRRKIINDLENKELKKFLLKIMINIDIESKEFMEDYSDSSTSGEENHCGCIINKAKSSVIDNSKY